MPRAKADSSKPRGHMTAYAYFMQTCHQEHKDKYPDENVFFLEFSKCANEWKMMSDMDKKRFQDMADSDKLRFDNEMQHYQPPSAAGGRKAAKDPNAPKRSLSAFFWFCSDLREGIKEQHPDYSLGDIAKELGWRWGNVDEATKANYFALAERDKARYEREMASYKKMKAGNNYDDAEDDVDDEDGDDDDE